MKRQALEMAGDHLVLVTFYTRTAVELAALVAEFELAARIRFATVLVVDNSGHLAGIQTDERTRVLGGTNSFQEFSGWLEGIGALEEEAGGRLTLLNDSYGRNWEISRASRPIIAAMYRDAARGRIAGWLDNFSHFGPPRFSRRPNSRVVVMPRDLAGIFAASLDRAMKRSTELAQAGQPLFDEASERRLRDWIGTQTGRWDESTLAGRWRRIFVEHHVFDGVPREKLSLRPRSYVGSLIYAAARHLAGERR